MAEKRMFAKKIVGAGSFLTMSRSARLLYYDLGMEADDDGMVEALGVLRKTCATRAMLRELEEHGYIKVMNQALVTKIVHWNTNNRLRHDRYKPGAFADLAMSDGQLTDGQTDDGQLTDNGQTDGGQMTDNGQTDDGQLTSQYRGVEESRGESKSGEGKTGEKKAEERKGENAAPKNRRAERFAPPTPEEVLAYVRERGSAVDPQRFVDFYASKGWRIGSQPMKDWRAAVRTWERREERGPSPGAIPSDEAYREGW